MKQKQDLLSALDIVILIKIVALDKTPWLQTDLADALDISQSEVSKSLQRLDKARLISSMKGEKIIRRQNILDLLQHGVRYMIPQWPGPITRGMPTAHAAPPLADMIRSNEAYVWPYGRGKVRGQSIVPLYPTVPEAASKDPKFYEIIALVDALRVGRAREQQLGMEELKKRILDGKFDN